MSFFSNILDAVNDNLISGDAYYLIAKALIVTVAVTLVAWAIAFGLGALISYVGSYEKKIVSRIGRFFSFLFRSTPVLLAVLLFFYVFKGGSQTKGIIICGLAIGLFGAGHLSEILIGAVREEQSKLTQGTRDKLEKVYFSTVLPQALEDSIFHVKRIMILMFQWTTVAGYISVNDLAEVMMGIGQRTMYPFFSIAFSILVYLVVTIVIELIYRAIVKKIKK
ncbi:MAG: ABC transporter permease subunit [Lachnospiraceae bacterium]|nr:ABC transporter permease subunit [Lachnospiraceae bacterium]